MRHTAVGIVILLVLGLLAPLLATEAQPPAKGLRIGYLGEAPEVFVDAFRRGLRDHGYVEGQNIAIEYRWSEGGDDRLVALAAELVQLKVAAIVTAGTRASHAAKRATGTMPIVMAHVGDPVGTGLVGSLARPGGNITGVSVLGTDAAGKRLALLKEIVPRAARVAYLWAPTNPASGLTMKETKAAAVTLGVTLQAVEFRNPDGLEKALATVRTERVDAVIVAQDQTLFAHRARIFEFARKNRLPAMYMYGEWAYGGGLMAYGANLHEVYRRVAALMDKILKGMKPADLPVEQVTRLELVVNLNAARAIGVVIPPSILARADEVIQ